MDITGFRLWRRRFGHRAGICSLKRPAAPLPWPPLGHQHGESLKGFHQNRNILGPVPQRQFMSLPPRQGPDCLGQLGGGRHLGAVDEQRKNPQVRPTERFDNFLANPVLGVVEASPPLAVGRRQPFRSDDHQHHGAVGKRLVQRLDKVGTRRDARNILEYPVGSEMFAQAVSQPTDAHAGIFTTVVDENSRHVLETLAPWRRWPNYAMALS